MVGTEDTCYFTVSTQLVCRSSSAYNSFFLEVIRPNRHYLTTKSDYSRWYPYLSPMDYLLFRYCSSATDFHRRTDSSFVKQWTFRISAVKKLITLNKISRFHPDNQVLLRIFHKTHFRVLLIVLYRNLTYDYLLSR